MGEAKPLGSRGRKARQWGRKDKDELREQAREAWTQTRTYASVFRKGAVKSGISIRGRLDQARRGEFSIPKPSKRKVILIVTIAFLSGLLITDQFLRPQFIPSVFGLNWTVTNLGTLWNWGGKTANLVGSLAEFSTRLATYSTESAFGETWPVVELNSNSTHTAFALTKASTSFDTVAAHQFSMLLTYRYVIYNNPGANTVLGMYLTRNGTLPSETADYDPETDRNVAVVMRVHADVADSSVASLYWFVQREATRTISQDSGGAIDTTGTTFLFTSFTQQVPAVEGAGNLNRIYGVFNYTGNQANAASLSRLSTQANGADVDDNTKVLPWFQFQGTPYYIGFYLRPTASDTTVRMFGRDFSTSAGMGGSHVARSDPALSAQQAVPQQIDTGGFFGPLIKALIGLGIWILNGIAQFLGFVADAFVDAMDAVGGFFGIGAVGTAILNFLTGIGNFIANVVLTIFGWGANFASFFQNGIAFISNYLSTQLAFLISLLTSIGGLWAIVADMMNALGATVLAANQVLIIWYIAGLFWTFDQGWNGFKSWIDITDTLLLKMIRLGWTVSKEGADVIIRIKDILLRYL